MWILVSCGYLLTRSDDACGDIVCANIWNFAHDTANNWYDKQIEAGKRNQAIINHHAQYDVVDYYDNNSQK
jgi:immune inhibitor A